VRCRVSLFPRKKVLLHIKYPKPPLQIEDDVIRFPAAGADDQTSDPVVTAIASRFFNETGANALSLSLWRYGKTDDVNKVRTLFKNLSYSNGRVAVKGS
jgi:hypothetical protein